MRFCKVSINAFNVNWILKLTHALLSTFKVQLINTNSLFTGTQHETHFYDDTFLIIIIYT